MQGRGYGMCNQFRLKAQNQALTFLILGSFGPNTCACLDTFALEIGTSASLTDTTKRQMMQSWALGKQISMHKLQQIELSGHNWIDHHSHYIPI
jgi:hypothetical protein